MPPIAFSQQTGSCGRRRRNTSDPHKSLRFGLRTEHAIGRIKRIGAIRRDMSRTW